jgi:hypothetical protein
LNAGTWLLSRNRLSHSTLKPFLSSFSIFHELKFGKPLRDISLVKDSRKTATKNTKVSNLCTLFLTAPRLRALHCDHRRAVSTQLTTAFLSEEGPSTGVWPLPEPAQRVREFPQATWELQMWLLDLDMV